MSPSAAWPAEEAEVAAAAAGEVAAGVVVAAFPARPGLAGAVAGSAATKAGAVEFPEVEAAVALKDRKQCRP